MAFCSKCGAQLEDNVTFCPACGAGKEKTAATQPAADNKQSDGKKGSNKLIPVIGVAVVAVVVIVLLVSVLGGGAKKPLKSLVKAMNSASCDFEDYVDATNMLYADIVYDAFDLVGDIDKDIKEDLDEAIVENLEDAYDEFVDYFGKDVKITYEIEDEEEIDKEDLEAIEEALIEVSEQIADEELSDADELMDKLEELLKMYRMEDALEDIATEKNVKKVAKLLKSVEKNFGKAKVSAGYVITVDVEIEGKENDEKLKDLTLTVLKINGKWGIEPSSLMNFIDNIIEFNVEDVAQDVAMSIVSDLMK